MINRHKISTKSIVPAVLLFLSIFTYADTEKLEQQTSKRNILCLMSYHPGNQWEDQILLSFKESLLQKKPNVKIYIEYLDSKRFPVNKQFIRMKSLIKSKYSGIFFDAIMCGDDNALRFILKNSKKLFKNIPVVFCGVNSYHPEMISKTKNITGVLENVNYLDTITVAMKLFPGTREIVVIYDNTLTGRGNREAFTNIIQILFQKYPGLDIKYLSGRDLTSNQLFEQISKLPPSRICILTSWFKDKNGTYIDEKEFSKRLMKISNVPIFCVTALFPGSIGGKIDSAILQGEKAANLISEILGGKKAYSIPPVRHSYSDYVFDYDILRRWNININELPPNSKIVNKPFYEKHKRLVQATIALLIAQTVIIIMLIVSIVKRIKAERSKGVIAQDLEITLHSIGDGVVTTDANGIIERINPVALKLSGWSSKSAIGQPISKVLNTVNTNTGEKIELPVKKVLESKRTIEQNQNTTLISLTGTEYYISSSAAPIKNKSDKLLGVIMVFRNITEDYQHKESLMEAEERFRTMFDHAPLLIALMNPDGTPVYYNKSWSDVSGASQESLMTFTAGSLTHPGDRERNSKEYLNIAQKKQLRTTFEKRYQFPNNKIIEVKETLVPVYGRGNKVKYIMSIAKDLSSDSKTQRELKWEREQRELILRSASETIMHLDKNMRIVWANRNPLKSDQDIDDIKGQNYYNIVFGTNAAIENCPIIEMYRTATPQRSEITTNDCLVLFISATPVKNDLNELDGAVVTIMDMTELRNLEQQLLHSQKMDAVGKLAGGVAHDFNNIIQVILGYGDLIKSKLVDPKAKSMWENIINAGKSAKNLVRQLLTFSRTENTPDRHIEDLNNVLTNFKKMISRILGENIKFQIKQCESELNVLIDTGQIEQVLMNLCINARDAMQNGGKLAILTYETDYAPLVNSTKSPGITGRFACCEVTDTGCGIPMELQSRIFEPFFTTKQAQQGTGLGLATTYAIIEKHGGVITVNSAIDKGTVFRFYLPIIEDSSKIDAYQSQEDMLRYHAKNSETILLVEDEPMVREIGKTLLQNSGYNVIEAADGQEGINLYNENQETIDLALLDVVLPEKSGKDVADYIKSVNPNLPILFCSGYTRDIIDSQSIENKLLRKPYNPDTLIKRIHEELSKAKRKIQKID